jgi:flagellar biosynthesis chaperone FliJ
MIMTKQHIPPAHAGNHQDPHYEWNDDCLVLTVLLSSILSGKAMKKLLVKNGYQELVQEESPHQMLQTLHAVCHQDKKVTAQIGKMLHARFGNTVAKVKKLDEAQIRNESLARTWLAPYLWACYCHPDHGMRKLGRELAHAAVLRGLRKDGNPDQLKAAKGKAENLTAQLLRLNQKLADMREENKSLKSGLRRKMAKDARVIGASPDSINQSRKDLKELRRQLAEQKRRFEKQTQELATWRSLALSYEEKSTGLPENTGYCSGGSHGCSPDPCRDCAEQPLCANPGGAFLQGRKVAIIGGLERLEPQYRDLIERMGGSCLFSNGHTKNGGKEFRSIVKKSDLVICITAINSHGAMKVIKKQCKICRKPFCPLKGTSVGSLKGLLTEYASSGTVPVMFGSAN